MEFVYVIDRRELFDLAFPHGFVGQTPPEGHPPLATTLERIAKHGFFVERPYAEVNSHLKQIIPYTLVRHDETLFCVRRLPQGGEARLHGKRSVGIGGHLNPEDDQGDRGRLLENGARRELDEELNIDAPFTLRPAGVINDDANPVGSVHFGVVLEAQLEAPKAKVREEDMLEGDFTSFATLGELLTDPNANFETWSSLILERLDDALGK